MLIQIFNRRDVLGYAAVRVALTVLVTGAVTAAAVFIHLGSDPSATVSVGRVATAAIVLSITVSALLSGAMSYRSALLLRQLTLTRQDLFRIARTDQLTGLLNRRGFDDAATAILEQAQRADLEVVALMCDIDRFKSINDRFGHEFGDRVLVKISQILHDFAAANNMVIARHGGEEFAGLLVGVSGEQATVCAEMLRSMCTTEVSENNVSSLITVSIGLTSHRGETDLSRIMRCADRALYLAKEGGRNCVVQIDTKAPLIAA